MVSLVPPWGHDNSPNQITENKSPDSIRHVWNFDEAVARERRESHGRAGETAAHPISIASSSSLAGHGHRCAAPQGRRGWPSLRLAPDIRWLVVVVRTPRIRLICRWAGAVSSIDSVNALGSSEPFCGIAAAARAGVSRRG